jgi:hypothetical protein
MLLLFRDSHFQLTDSLRPYNLDREHDVAGVIAQDEAVEFEIGLYWEQEQGGEA